MAKFVKGRAQEPEALRRLDFRARRVLGLFAYKETITAPQVAAELGLSERTARNLLKAWVDDGWLQVANPSRRARAYSLSAEYRQYLGSLSAMKQGGEKNEQPLLRR
jgi:transposase